MIAIPEDEYKDEDPPNDEEGVNSEEDREELMEDDELEPWEEGFMEGAEAGGQEAKCRKCGKILEREETLEREIDGDLVWFCSEECSEKYEKEKEEKGAE
ncbi:hypothetical protein HYS48_02850 [Candidatus Woesearchaeota archaeon]|nr:hypothetical protein [Candidatus Woesearchaeota archaeon]